MDRTYAQDPRLGNLIKTFGPNRANAKVLLYVIPVFVLVGLIFFFSGFSRSRPADAAGFITGGIIFLLIAAGVFWGYRRQLSARADVYEHGFFWKHWMGNQQIVLWEEITAIYEFIGYSRNMHYPTQWAYTVCRKNAPPLKVNMAVENIHSLGVMIMAEFGKRVLPSLLDAYQAGSAAMIDGELGFSRQGIIAGGNTLPWEQVEKIHISNQGDLWIHKKGQRMAWKIMIHSRIASFPAFLVLLHHAVDNLLPGARPVLEDPFSKDK